MFPCLKKCVTLTRTSVFISFDAGAFFIHLEIAEFRKTRCARHDLLNDGSDFLFVVTR